MYIKTVPAKVKAVGEAQGLQPGQFTALVSVFGNEDSYGDVVARGAFAEDLERWKTSGDPMPVIWSHKWSDPFAHIGSVVEAAETDEGLVVTAQIEDLEENATAAQVHRLLKGRRVTQFSFAYDVDEGGWVDVKDHRWGGYYELRKLKVHEVGPCLIGANQETNLIAAKAAELTRGMKAGRVLSQTNYDRLVKARDSITSVLDAATPEDDTDAKQHASQPARETANGGDPAREPHTPPAKSTGRSAQAAARLHLMTTLNGA
ncbi:HK97 family phage prohead protease [Nocardiopsis synnemataformans]|uniref:HK97 family phage prohead protease n=1 Tax=Nocardiopsis synnemataformans TaxID=61305 RepID=UPI003EB82F20